MRTSALAIGIVALLAAACGGGGNPTTRVEWGAGSLGRSVSVLVRADEGGIRWDLPLTNVTFAEGVQFSSGGQRTRVHFTDYSTIIVEACPRHGELVPCTIGEFWQAWLDAVKSPELSPLEYWSSAIKVLPTANGCTEVIVIGGFLVESYTRGLVPGFPDFVRINFENHGPQVRTCLTGANLEDFARGAYYPLGPF
jgi:hypothetical protein